MSFHKNDTPEIKEALRLHGLEADSPSQLSDAFRLGFLHAQKALVRAEPGAGYENIAGRLKEVMDEYRDAALVDIADLIEKLKNPAIVRANQLRGIIATPAYEPPEGYAIVPIEPTIEMLQEAVRFIELGIDGENNPVYISEGEAANTYKAMIAVALQLGVE